MEEEEERRGDLYRRHCSQSQQCHGRRAQKNGSEKEEAQFMRFILASKDAAFFLLDETELEKQMALLSANSRVYFQGYNIGIK